MKKKLVLILLMCLTFSMSGCICDSKKEGQSVSVDDLTEEDESEDTSQADASTESEDDSSADADNDLETPLKDTSEDDADDASKDNSDSDESESGTSGNKKPSTQKPSTQKPVVTPTPTAAPDTPQVTPTPTAAPGTPQVTPTPGVPKITPTPAVPKVTPTPAVPKVTPTPGVPQVTPIPTPAPTPTPEYTIPGIVKDGSAVDEAGVLIYVPNAAVEENASQQIFLFQDNLLISSSSYDFELGVGVFKFKLISLDTGEVLYEQILQNVSWANVQVCGDQIAVSDVDNGKIHVLNDKLEKTKEYSVSADNVFVNTALTEAYCFNSNYRVYALNLETEEERNLLTDVYQVFPSVLNGNSLSMSYVDSVTGYSSCAGLNLETGVLEKMKIDAAFNAAEYHAGDWMAGISGTDQMNLLGTQEEPYKFKTPVSGMMMDLLGGTSRLLLTEYGMDGGQTLSVYDMDGTFLSSVTLSSSMMGLSYDPVWLESAGGYLFTAMDENYKDQLYFWDLSVEVSGNNLELIPYDQEEDLGGEELPQEYYDRAKELSEKYGVTIKIADQCETDYGTKIVKQELNPEVIEVGFEVLENTLSNFPDNFFEQLNYGDVRKMEINLMGEIADKEPIEGHIPAGFVQTENGTNTMVLNIAYDTEELTSTIYHETAHIIDYKLEYDARFREDALYSEESWLALNPEGFEYSGAYGTYPEEFWNYFTHFVDSYSMTFAAEDRARIFEYAAMHKTNYFHPENTPACIEKLRYFSACIRDAFDTTGWPEETVWEYTLNHAGESSGGGKG